MNIDGLSEFRLYIIRSLAGNVRLLSIEEIRDHVFPIVRETLHENDASLREALVEQTPEICRFLLSVGREQPEKYGKEIQELILSNLVPMVAELTTDPAQQV